MNTTNQPLPDFASIQQSIETMHDCAVDALARAQAAEMENDRLRNALNLCEHVIGMARLQGKLDNSGLSPVNDALLAARAALESMVRISPDWPPAEQSHNIST